MTQKTKFDRQDQLSGIQTSLKTKSNSTYLEKEKHLAQSTQPVMMNKELKRLAFKRFLVRVQKQLSTPEKLSSIVIHQPVIDKISEAASRSVARPAGILGGGLISFLGSSLLLYTAKRYGFEYNFTVFFILYAVGFCAGLIAELGFRVMRRNH